MTAYLEDKTDSDKKERKSDHVVGILENEMEFEVSNSIEEIWGTLPIGIRSAYAEHVASYKETW